MARRKTIVVIGGALSGPTAAARARELDEDARIVLIEKERDISYAVGGVGYYLSGEVESLEALNGERAEYFEDVYRLEVLSRTKVTEIDAVHRRVALRGDTLGYDSLVFAAGAESIVPKEIGKGRNVMRLRTLRDLEAIAKALDAGAKNVAVVGGGYFGVEVAEGLARRGALVTLLERSDRLLPGFSLETSRRAEAALRALGVTVVTHAELTRSYQSGSNLTTLGLAGRQSLKTDLVVVAAGLQPRSQLLKKAGADLLENGTVAIDTACKTSLPGVFACGAVVAPPHAISGQPVWFPQAAQADKSAQVAGARAAGGRASLGAVLGTAIVRAGSVQVARTGLTDTAASDWLGDRLGHTRVHTTSHDAFMPGAAQLSVLVWYDQKGGQLIGAEVAGPGSVDKQIDVLATAITGGLGIDQLSTIDFAYAPPFSAARSPVNVAGTVAAAARSDLVQAWSPAELAEAADRLAVIDVRGPEAYREGSIPGAVNVPLDKLRQLLTRLGLAGAPAFVSDDGKSGFLAARIARQRGAKGAGYLAGGIESWLAEGRRLAKPDSSES